MKRRETRTAVRRPHMSPTIPVVSFLGCGDVLKCLHASLSAEAESGTFAFFCTRGHSEAAGLKRILEVCQLFLIIHEVYSDDSFGYYTHARHPAADMACGTHPALVAVSLMCGCILV